MKVILKNKNQYVLRFELGENYPASFIQFLKKEKISGGFFFGLGGMGDPEIAYYDLKKKKYLSKKFGGVFEVLSLIGNVAIRGTTRKKNSAESGIIIHNHVVLGNRNYKIIGGHLIKAKIGATLEIILWETGGLKRNFDTLTGLNILD